VSGSPGSVDEATALPTAAALPAARRSTFAAVARRLTPSVGPGLMMLIIGLIGADHPVLSWDEVTTADVAQRSPAQIVRLLHNIDAVLSPYYFLMHFWTGLVGSSEWDLRAPSILAMAAAVGVAGELGRRLFTPLIGTVAGALLCVMPNTSRYAAEARPYAITCLLSVSALLLLHVALDSRRRWRWPVYGVAVVLLGLSHIIALTTLCAHAAAVLHRARRERSWRTVAVWGAAAGVAVAALIPVALVGVSQQQAQVSWVPALTPHRLLVSPGTIVGSVATAWALLGLVVFIGWRPAHRVVEVALLAIGPLTVVGLLSALGDPLWVPRYLLVVLAPLALLAAAAVVGRPESAATSAATAASPRLAVRLGLVLVLLICSAYPGQRHVRGATAKNGADYRSIAALIRQRQQPGDGIVYQPGSRTLRAGLSYYLRDDPGQPQDLLLSRSAAQAGVLRAEERPDPQLSVAGADRVWLLVTLSRPDPLTERPELRPLLQAQYRRVGLWHVRWATLALYQRRADAPR
jgi:mannosyltransferase